MHLADLQFAALFVNGPICMQLADLVAIGRYVCNCSIYLRVTYLLQFDDGFASCWSICDWLVSLLLSGLFAIFFLYICDWNLLIKLQFNFLIYLQLADLFIIGRSRCNFHSSCNWPTCLQLFDLFAIDRSIFNWTIDLQGVDRFPIGLSLRLVGLVAIGGSLQFFDIFAIGRSVCFGWSSCNFLIYLQLADLFIIVRSICNWPIYSICNWPI